ncbi:hypothetical protein CONLIGDRAFT_46622 [Coniochaeta ligniaria NRRL 30616]|uniref:Uncharacterized protein n=1 Tax=Coniochaeta ligniaria NRRL 30616 TaxID=1408157 RepID=A0A1J7J6Y4_9PEZI|nr:hypothetical protein CONLIGDRAFT_46622 [Coniochaeta ligniaria NRRL 30616]
MDAAKKQPQNAVIKGIQPFLDPSCWCCRVSKTDCNQQASPRYLVSYAVTMPSGTFMFRFTFALLLDQSHTIPYGASALQHLNVLHRRALSSGAPVCAMVPRYTQHQRTP